MSKLKTLLVAFAVIAVSIAGLGTAAATTGLLGDQSFTVDGDTQELRTTVNGTANATVTVYAVDSDDIKTELQTNVSMTEVDPDDGYDLYEYSYDTLDTDTYESYEFEVYGNTSLDTTTEFEKLTYTPAGGTTALGDNNTMLYGVVAIVLVGGAFFWFTRDNGGRW